MRRASRLARKAVSHSASKCRRCCGPSCGTGGSGTGGPLRDLCFRSGGENEQAPARSRRATPRFRRDLARAFGIEVPEWVEVMRKNKRKDRRLIWKVARPMTQRERMLLEETEAGLPTDFHPWRRAYSQALADANVNAQQAKALAGHATEAAHSRYLLNSEKMRAIPAAALPKLSAIFSHCQCQKGKGERDRKPKSS